MNTPPCRRQRPHPVHWPAQRCRPSTLPAIPERRAPNRSQTRPGRETYRLCVGKLRQRETGRRRFACTPRRLRRQGRALPPTPRPFAVQDKNAQNRPSYRSRGSTQRFPGISPFVVTGTRACRTTGKDSRRPAECWIVRTGRGIRVSSPGGFPAYRKLRTVPSGCLPARIPCRLHRVPGQSHKCGPRYGPAGSHLRIAGEN